MPFPHHTQLDVMDCGPTSLCIIAQFYGKHYSLQNLREKCHLTREGVSLLGISDAAETIGLRTVSIKPPGCNCGVSSRCRVSFIGTSGTRSTPTRAHDHGTARQAVLLWLCQPGANKRAFP